jgi:tellurium resistance protein TerD
MAVIKLSKGQKINLTKDAPEMTEFQVALGWNPSEQPGVDFDLDVSAYMIGSDGKVVPNESFVYYGNLKSLCESVVHSGDNLTGDGDGDDEVITVDLTKVPANIEKIAFITTIHEAASRSQNFGQVSDAYVRLVNKSNGEEKFKFDLSEDHSVGISLLVCELYRHNGDWKFNPQGQSSDKDLGAICSDFGLDAA